MIKMYQVDAFTSKMFKGNPAAVCLLEEEVDEGYMKNIAKEMNLSETAFLLPHKEHVGAFNLRWFTPCKEVDLCGHATLAAAHILWTEGILGCHQEAHFYTRSGLLTAKRIKGFIQLDFPQRLLEYAPIPEELQRSLGVTPVHVKKGQYGYLIELENEQTVRNLEPDYRLIAKIPLQGVIVTAQGNEGTYDFVSRYFAPGVGINEDPVTGSAHCALAPYWQKRLGKNQFVAYQASPRGGELKIRIKGHRVLLSGQAVTVMKGILMT